MKGGMKAREMEESDGTREEMETEKGNVCVSVCACMKAVQFLWSPKVSPVAAHGERLDCALPP